MWIGNALLLMIIVSSSLSWPSSFEQTGPKGQLLIVSVSLPPWNLTIVAPNGTQVVLHEDDIGRLTPYRAYGGFVNSLGYIKDLGNYTGVPIDTFVNTVCGICSDYSVNIIANDSYTVNYTKTQGFEEYNGTALVTYDNMTGQPVQHNQTLTPMLAYYCNDANLTDGGPLRLVIVGPEGLLTDGKLWVKWVVTLEVCARYIDDVAVTDAAPSKTVVGQGYVCNLTATAANLGSYDETFNVTLYANQTAFGTQTVTLPAGNSTTLSFAWNTAGYAYSNYTISAYATPVPGETNTANNNFTAGWVIVSIVGDVTGPNSVPDGRVNLMDVYKVAMMFGSSAPTWDPYWGPVCDINNDGTVNLKDYYKVCLNFGQTYP
jgi:hypothetical protein